MALALSTSGQSPNLVHGLDVARELGADDDRVHGQGRRASRHARRPCVRRARPSASTASRRRTSPCTTSSGTSCTSSSGRTMSSERRPRRSRATCPLPLHGLRPHPARPRQRRPMTAELIARCFLPAFRNQHLEKLDDQAVVDCRRGARGVQHRRLRRHPAVLPGRRHRRPRGERHRQRPRNGGCPAALSRGAFILEKGFPLADLERSWPRCGRRRPPRASLLVTGDTKVVDRGKADGCFVTTTVSAWSRTRLYDLRRSRRPGDVVILERRHRRARHGDHGGARRPRAGDARRERYGAAAPASSHDMLATGRRRPLPARSDPRRRGDGAERARAPVGRRHRARRGRNRRPRARAWRLRAARPRPALRRQRRQAPRRRARRRTPSGYSTRCAGIPKAAMLASSARSWRTTHGWSC